MKIIYLVLGVLFVLVSVIACQSSAAPSLAGTYSWTVSKDQAAQAGWTGDLICENAGNYQILFSPSGSTTLTQTPIEGCGQATVPVIVGTWKVTGDQLEYHEITDSGCGTPTAVYKWKLEGTKLTLNKVSDTCQLSAGDTAPKIWTKTQ